MTERTDGIEMIEGAEYFLTIQYTPEMFSPFSDLAYYYDVATVVRGDDGGWFLGGFGPDITLLARMRIRDATVAVKEPQLDEGKLTVFPNPVNDQLNVQIELETVSEQVEVKIMDATGRNLETRLFDNIRIQQVNFNTEQYPAGNYFLHVRTAEGVKTKRFVVQH